MDQWIPRIALVGLILCGLLSIGTMGLLAANAVEAPSSLGAVATTCVGAIAVLLASNRRNGDGQDSKA